MTKKLSRFIYFLVCFVFFVFFNLYISDLIVDKLLSGYEFSTSILSLTYVKNTGAAFSIMQNSTEALIILSVAAIVLLFVYVIRHLSGLYMKSLFFFALLCAGIAGNLHERMSLGFVRDYFELNFINFPVFNISDIFINLGVIAIVLLILLKKIK